MFKSSLIPTITALYKIRILINDRLLTSVNDILSFTKVSAIEHDNPLKTSNISIKTEPKSSDYIKSKSILQNLSKKTED